MYPKSLEEPHLFVWVSVNALFFFFLVFIILIWVKGWAKKRNSLTGYRTIMSFRSEKVWNYTNNIFFKLLFYLNAICLVINTIHFAINKNYSSAYNLSLKVFFISLIAAIFLIEILAIVKFNWKGEPRNSSNK